MVDRVLIVDLINSTSGGGSMRHIEKQARVLRIPWFGINCFFRVLAGRVFLGLGWCFYFPVLAGSVFSQFWLA